MRDCMTSYLNPGLGERTRKRLGPLSSLSGRILHIGLPASLHPQRVCRLNSTELGTKAASDGPLGDKAPQCVFVNSSSR